ncbi:MAG: TldD/PmbA family protein [Candidatus Marinimicrobia bacterium]|jgi:predicted Zn-dependent protease|nr:TldD/PmbA family protein [Candidatus Neomarinimicrobiota bacterium]
MEQLFNQLSETLLNNLHSGEQLKVAIGGENSQFVRFSQSKVRQSGLVDDASLDIILIKDGRTCSGSFTLTGNIDVDEATAMAEMNRLRAEVGTLPKDPFVVMPEDTGSSREEHNGNLLSAEETVSALSPAMQGVDLAGIWASGRIFSGNANSAGQKHWFATDTFSLDYSLITPDERMVKGTYAGSYWERSEYEKNMAKSIAKLRMMEKPGKKIKPGSYRTYIAPAGVADIVGMFSWGGVGEASIQQGDSSLCKMRQNGIKMSPCFTLSEDFTSGIVPRFNSNGELAPEKLDLILAGSLKNTLVSSRTAKEYGVQSNYAGEGESLRSPVLSPGELNEDEVVKKIDNGIYLSNLHYLNWSDRPGGRITGMTRYACFWVENGEVVAPIENMRFDDSIYNFFGKNLEAVTDKAHLHPTVETYDGRELGGVSCPGILLKSFELTL